MILGGSFIGDFECFDLRWLVDECDEDIYSHGVFLEWINKDNEATMYTTTQKVADWPPIVYKKCPFFLDYPHGKYPEDEAAYYEEATKKFKQMVVQPVRLSSYTMLHRFILLAN